MSGSGRGAAAGAGLPPAAAAALVGAALRGYSSKLPGKAGGLPPTALPTADAPLPPGACTFSVTGMAARRQPLAVCFTCCLDAVCRACASRCHAGHHMAAPLVAAAAGASSGSSGGDDAPPPPRVRRRAGYCGCGAAGALCCAMASPSAAGGALASSLGGAGARSAEAELAYGVRAMLVALQLYLGLGGVGSGDGLLPPGLRVHAGRLDERDDEIGFVHSPELLNWAQQRHVGAAAAARAAGAPPPAQLKLPLVDRMVRFFVQSPFFRFSKLGSARSRLCPRHPQAHAVLALAAPHVRAWAASLGGGSGSDSDGGSGAVAAQQLPPELAALVGAHPLGPSPLDWVVDPWALLLLDGCAPLLEPPPSAFSGAAGGGSGGGQQAAPPMTQFEPWQLTLRASPLSAARGAFAEFSLLSAWEAQPVGAGLLLPLPPAQPQHAGASSSSAAAAASAVGAARHLLSSAVVPSPAAPAAAPARSLLLAPGMAPPPLAPGMAPPPPPVQASAAASSKGAPAAAAAVPPQPSPTAGSSAGVGTGTEFGRRLQAAANAVDFFARPEEMYADASARDAAGHGPSLSSGVRARAVPSAATAGVKRPAEGIDAAGGDSKRVRAASPPADGAGDGDDDLPPPPAPFVHVASLSLLEAEMAAFYDALGAARDGAISGGGADGAAPPALCEATAAVKVYSAKVPDEVTVHWSANNASSGRAREMAPSSRPVPRHRVCLLSVTLAVPPSPAAPGGSGGYARTLLVDPIAMGEAYAAEKLARGGGSGSGGGRFGSGPAVLLPARRAGAGVAAEAGDDRHNDDAIASETHVMTLLQPLLRLLSDPSVVKLLHCGGTDVMWLHGESGLQLTNVWDSFTGLDELLLAEAAGAVAASAAGAASSPGVTLPSSFVVELGHRHTLRTLAYTDSVVAAAAAGGKAASSPVLVNALADAAATAARLRSLPDAVDAVLGPWAGDGASHLPASLADVDWQARPLPARVLHAVALHSHRSRGLGDAVWAALAAGGEGKAAGGATPSERALARLAAATAASSTGADGGALLAGLQSVQRSYHGGGGSSGTLHAALPPAAHRAALRSQLTALRSPPFDLDHGGTLKAPITAPPWYSSCRLCGGRGHFYTMCARMR